ncbi:MAG TPA: hypothetical protein VLM42_06905 [Bryobacteraceae bacterium]|nr:hypothetical protein [Bryobacteraceae bacterium]
MNLFIGTMAVALGIFVTASPMRATKVWGWKQFDQLGPRHRTLYLRWYRAFGILLGLAGILFALDSLLSRS